MPTNTEFNPRKNSDFNKDDMEFNGSSIYFSCEPSATSYGEINLSDDHIVNGGTLIVEGGDIEDRVSFQIVHPLAGVIKQFVTDYGVASDKFEMNLEIGYPSKVPAGLKIRISYTASSKTGTRKILSNLLLHKILH